MRNYELVTPAELTARGIVSKEEMEDLVDHMQSTRNWLVEMFPGATFVIDKDNILRVEAAAQDAGEIDHILQETLSAFTPFSVKVIPTASKIANVDS